MLFDTDVLIWFLRGTEKAASFFEREPLRLISQVTWIGNLGADVKTAQSLARHSTSYLTMEVYAEAVDTRLANTAEVVGSMISQATDSTEKTPDAQEWPKSAQVPETTSSNKAATHCEAMGCCDKKLVPAGGIEPPTYGL